MGNPRSLVHARWRPPVYELFAISRRWHTASAAEAMPRVPQADNRECLHAIDECSFVRRQEIWLQLREIPDTADERSHNNTCVQSDQGHGY